MSDRSPILSLPLVRASQVAKEIVMNEAASMLEAILQLSVLSVSSAPPASPSDGDRYIVATGATGDWSSKEDQVAARIGGSWVFFAPVPGWIAYDQAEEKHITYKSIGWTDL